MSIWKDLFEIYQTAGEEPAGYLPSPSDNTDDKNDTPQQTVYVFAYVDDGKGNIARNIAVEDRITLLEMKNQELEHRYNSLLDRLGEDSDESDAE